MADFIDSEAEESEVRRGFHHFGLILAISSASLIA
jgi:hypothetical protein